MLISIIIPTFNRANVISKTLDSILAQEYQDWECIIIDDNSVDNTFQVVGSYVKKDSRFKVLRNCRKKGAQGARNTGILYSNSDWICIFDSDDYMYPNYLQEMIRGVENNVDVVVCHSNVVGVENNQIIRKFAPSCDGFIEEKLFSGEVYVPNNQTLIRKSKIISIGLLDEDCPSMQEWDTHIRLASTQSKYFTISKVLVNYFVGAKDAISTDIKREIKGRIYILDKHLKLWKKYDNALNSYCAQILYLSIKCPGIKNKINAIIQLARILPSLPFRLFKYKVLKFRK